MSAIETVAFNPTRFLEDVAHYIISQNRAALPHLAHLTIILPPRAAPALRAALAQAAEAGALMLPRMTTLRAWAAEATPPNMTVTPEAERVLDVFSALKKQGWFSANETLALSHELVRLTDELTDQLVTLPSDLDEHTRMLKRAYGVARQNSHFSFEANLTYDIWRALAEASVSGKRAVDSATLYGLQLAQLLTGLTHPLYVLGDMGDGGSSAREAAFFRTAAQRVPVTQFKERLTHIDTPREAFLSDAFRHAPGGDTGIPVTPPGGASEGLACYEARDVEDEATAALNTIKTWLMEGKTKIAVVALDRLAARRLRALAERDQILMADEIGWPYSTTLSATAVMRWLEAKRDGFYYQTLIDLLKSPFIFADLRIAWGRSRVVAAIMAIETVIRRAGVVAGLLRVRGAVVRVTADEQGDENSDALQLLDRLIEADRGFANTRRPAREWLAALDRSLATLGMAEGLAADAAGAGLLAVLQEGAEKVAASAIKLTMVEWVDWLRTLLEEARFRDDAVESPIVMTSLEATRYRRFDAAMLLGAAEGDLPGKPANSGVFNQAVRHTLGLPTHQRQLPVMTRDVIGLLTRSKSCWISWQAHHPREPQLASPWVSAMVLAAMRLGYKLNAAPPEDPISTRRLGQKPIARTLRPAPVLAFSAIPRRVSASAYQALVNCPYQFFGQAVLKLREADDVVEEMEKRDFGELVHTILNRFHQRVAIISAHPVAAMKAQLLQETEAVFAQALEQNFIARGWRLQWESAIDAYLAWQITRESQGWRWQAGEMTSAIELILDSDEVVRLEGRLDRLDTNGTQSGVIDYKARSASTLKAQLSAAGEDVQLPVYAALAEAKHPERAVSAAAYLAIEREKVKSVSLDAAEQAGSKSVARLEAIFNALYAGAPLPAQGAESACRYCTMRGLCRKDYWPVGEADD